MTLLIVPFYLFWSYLTQPSMSNGLMTISLSLAMFYHCLYRHASQSHQLYLICHSTITSYHRLYGQVQKNDILSSPIWTSAKKYHNTQHQSLAQRTYPNKASTSHIPIPNYYTSHIITLNIFHSIIYFYHLPSNTYLYLKQNSLLLSQHNKSSTIPLIQE